MNTDTPENPLNPMLAAEWQRQEAARQNAQGGDPIYRALHEAARAPLPAQLPADFMARIESRLRRPPADDRFEIGLLGLVIGVGGLLSLLFVLPPLSNLFGNLDLRLPNADALEVSWSLIGISALGLTALMSGAVEKLRNRSL